MAAPMFRRAGSLFLTFCTHSRQITIEQTRRSYARYIRRKPINVFTQNEAVDISKRQTKEKAGIGDVDTVKFGRTDHFVPSHTREKAEADEGFVIPTNIKYETLREGDKRFGPIVQIAKSRKGREKRNVILLEGRHLIHDAVSSGLAIKSLFFTSGKHLEGFPVEDLVDTGTALLKVKMSHMELWSDLTRPSGIMAVCEMPPAGVCQYQRERCLPVTLVCDGIREPGYLGILIRTAAAIGCERVLLMKGTVDIWEPKVLRSGLGAHFRVPLINNIGWELVANYFKSESKIYLADSRSDVQIQTESLPPSRKTQKRVFHHERKATEEVVSESNTMYVDDSYQDKDLVQAFDRVQLPVSAYSEQDFTKGHTVLVVSGENGTPSAEAKKLVFEKFGEQLCLPLENGIDRLNPAVSGSLILFEVQRQLRSVKATDCA